MHYKNHLQKFTSYNPESIPFEIIKGKNDWGFSNRNVMQFVGKMRDFAKKT